MKELNKPFIYIERNEGIELAFLRFFGASMYTVLVVSDHFDTVAEQESDDLGGTFHAESSLNGDGNSRFGPGDTCFSKVFMTHILRAGEGFKPDFISEDHADEMHECRHPHFLMLSSLSSDVSRTGSTVHFCFN